MDRHKSRNDKRRRGLRNAHPQGARFAYDGGHAPNAETFTHRVPVTVRSGSPATRRDLDGPGRDSAGSPSVSFPGLPGSVQQHVVVKERERGYDEATFVESFVILNAAGGECLDDFAHPRSDAGLAELVGHELPSPEAARRFLNAFHEEEKLLSDGLPIGSACAPASRNRNRNREVLAVPGAYNKPEFGPCAPVVATLRTDWGKTGGWNTYPTRSGSKRLPVVR
jgi:hypothetical protein